MKFWYIIGLKYSKFRSEFMKLSEDTIYRYQSGGITQGDLVVLRKDALKNDPFVEHHKEWQKAIKQLTTLKVRAEQQALAKHGLNFVITDYLPKKLKNPKLWLP